MSFPISSDILSDLNQFFTGHLMCIVCKKNVVFSIDLLNQHLKACSKNIPSLAETKDSGHSEMISRFRMHVKAHSSKNLLPELETYLKIEPFRNSVDMINKVKLSVKQFRCLFCNLFGTIDDWENHSLMCNHATASSLWCVCWLCETLLYGELKTVTDHGHFKKDAGFFFLNHFPSIADVLKNKLNNYYKFERKVDRYDPKLALYCGACDRYMLHSVDQHFSLPCHRLRTNITFDLFYCDSCFVLIYGDDKLFYSHTMSKNHFIMKTKNKKLIPTKPENIQHRILLMTIKAIIDENSSSIPFAQSYYCDLCFFVASNDNIWAEHLVSNEHNEISLREIVCVTSDEFKPFEFFCIHCRLSIFGTIITHIVHCTSFGHETIKHLTIEHHNKENMKAVMQTKALQSILISPAASSNSKNSCQIDKNLDNMVTPVSSTSCEQPSTSQVAQIDRSTGVFYSNKLFIYEKNLDTRNIVEMVKNLRDFLLETWTKLNVQQCKTHCILCHDYSSNDSKWWTHLSSQRHMDKLNQHCGAAKSCKILFCLCCNTAILGSSSIGKKHLAIMQHKKKAEQFMHSIGENVIKSKEIISNGIVPGDTTSQFPEAFHSNEEFIDDLKSCQKNNEAGFFRTQSMSSNSSSKNENDDKSEDDADVVSYVLLNGEENGEEKVSDHELDDSFLSEIKSNLPEAAGTSKFSESEVAREMNNSTDGGNTEFVKHLIIAKGIPPQYIQNKRICLDTFRRYGIIKRIFTKKNRPDWLYLMVLTEPEEVFNRLQQNIKTLKVTLGTDELNIEYDTRNTDQTGIKKSLTNDVKEVFSNMNSLNKAVQDLMRLYEEESNSEESKFKVKNLENTVLELAQKSYGPSIPVRVFTFGSRVTELATKNSDVDIYLQIDHSFGGGVHENVALQQQLVLFFSNKMKQQPNDFRNIVSIPFARVPIIKFTHMKSNLNCDLSFKSGLSTMNSLLVKTYLKLDDRIKYLVCAVKLWMKKNDLADRNLFTTYAQIWMVLFFLMQPEHAVVPTVLKLRNELPATQRNIIVEGWNCAFPKGKNIVWRSSCSLSKEELLLKFFQFYSQENLQNYVLCTLTGIKMQKKYFHELYLKLPPQTFDEYKRKLRRDQALYYKVIDDFDGLCIQDPFDHCHNLTKTIGVRKFLSFINLCQQTVGVMNQIGST